MFLDRRLFAMADRIRWEAIGQRHGSSLVVVSRFKCITNAYVVCRHDESARFAGSNAGWRFAQLEKRGESSECLGERSQK